MIYKTSIFVHEIILIANYDFSGNRVSGGRGEEIKSRAEADGINFFRGLTSTVPPRQRAAGRTGQRDAGGRPHRAHHGIANSNLRCHMLF